MITKNDTILLLSELEDDYGVNVEKMVDIAMRSPEVNVAVVKFINSHRPLDANKFYDKIRKSYNQKKSKLYINIVREDLENPVDALTILTSLCLQILLYCKQLDGDRQMFLRHMRYSEICQVLLNYSKTFDLVPCLKLLRVIKADLKAFEYFAMDKNAEN